MKKKRNKCGECNKKIINTPFRCQDCGLGLHKQCISTDLNDTQIVCTSCLQKHLPFYKTLNCEFKESLNDKVKLGNLPSFKIQSLIDDLKRNQNEDDSFLSDQIKSTYFTPSEFIENKFCTENCSVIHINVASLGLHIDELKSLLSTLNHDFDVLTITETKIKDSSSNLINFEIEGYNNFFTPTKTNFGGSMIYVKNSYSSKLLPEYSKSEEGIF